MNFSLGSFKPLALLVASAVFVEYLVYSYLRYRNIKCHNENSVLVFRGKNFQCRTQNRIHNTDLCGTGCSQANMNYILQCVKNCRTSLDVCMYFITNSKLIQAVIEASHRGVAVRIITNKKSEELESGMLEFWKRGIPVRMKTNTEELMHHKFVIFDKTMLMVGSCNWTNQSFAGNYENIMVSTDEDLVEPFILQFDHLWNDFSRN